MSASKVTQVADSVHQSIPLTRLEKAVISTAVFNRLHNVLQNSTAYMTFPSVRTSRFSHSLGTTHVAGQLLRWSFLNAEDEDQVRLLLDVNERVVSIQDSDEFKTCVDLLSIPQATRLLRSVDELLPSEPMLRALLPGVIDRPADRYLFLVAMQATRLVALLHDVGHPPFSHVVEAALSELFDIVEAINVSERSKRQQTFRDIFHGMKQTAGKQAFHELISINLLKQVLIEILRAPGTLSEAEKVFTLTVRSFAAAIMSNADPFFASLHTLVDGDLDADRLDYVARDANATAMYKEPCQYARLFNCFQLRYVAAQEDRTLPLLFAPRVQALSSIEEFFQRRFALYRFFACHHRVAKTDALLQAILVGLGERYLRVNEEEIGRGDRLVHGDIDGLWLALDKSLHHSVDEASTHFLQWDDAWLLTSLRIQHFGPGLHPANRLSVQLDEMLSNRRCYYPMFKRIDDFLDLERSCLHEALSGDVSLRDLEQAMAGDGLSKLGTVVAAALVEFREGAQREESVLRSERGLFVTALLEGATQLGIGGRSGRRLILDALEKVRGNFNVQDVLLSLKRPLLGVTEDFPVLRDSKPVRLGDISSVAKALEYELKLVPPFYAYMYHDGPFREEALVSMRKEAGVELWRTFVRYILNAGTKSPRKEDADVR